MILNVSVGESSNYFFFSKLAPDVSMHIKFKFLVFSCGLPVGGICSFFLFGQMNTCISKPDQPLLYPKFAIFTSFQQTALCFMINSPFALLLLWQEIHFFSRMGCTRSANTKASSRGARIFLLTGVTGASTKFSP